MVLTIMARFTLGLTALLFSLGGLLLCLAGVVAVWTLRRHVEALAGAAFSAADESMDFVVAKVDRVKQGLSTSRERVSGITRLAERLRDGQTEAREKVQPLLDGVDAVFQQLEAAEAWLDATHAAALGVARVSSAVMSSQYAAADPEATGVALAQRVQEVSETVADAVGRLQLVRQELVELRNTGKLAHEVVSRIIGRVADLDGKLANACTRLEKFDARAKQFQASVSALHHRIRWWMSFAAVGLTIVLAWFAISQLAMIRSGWHLL
jgi:chromosome segregation ATPase